MDPKLESRLRCRYFTNKNHPFLILGPIQEEEAYLNPRLVVYHNVISDSEIETVKKLAQPRVSRIICRSKDTTVDLFYDIFFMFQFKRATVQNQVTGELEPASYRISKSAWLKTEEHKHVADVCPTSVL